ncbi:MAG TPA: TetR/AcrR family transcriptional regulator [Myxococcaceae bacterium]|nr:TetR/AcrR family transcriptional regulator [Myxococcaceae bacterium]
MAERRKRAAAPEGSGGDGPEGAASEGLRAKNKREKEERILAAARELLSERGFEATTTRDIAERAGIGTGTLFLYVRTKEELLLRLFRQLVEGAQARLFGALPEDAPLVERLMFVFGGFFDMYAEDPRLSRTYIRELLFLPPDVAEEHAEVVRAFLGRLGGLLEAAKARGEVDAEVDPMVATLGFFSLYLTTLLAWLNGPPGSEPMYRQALRDGLQLQLRGLAPARRRPAQSRSDT